MHSYSNSLQDFDEQIFNAIENEKTRQEIHIELIASENYTSTYILEACGSVLTNKYAEGYPYKRYYGGCQNVDVVEELAINRAKDLFGADYANVQPHSGSSANLAVYFALLNAGDTVLGMSLADGGHLTHGSKVNFSGKVFNSVSYGIDNKTGKIDYDEVEKLAQEHKPRMIVAGFSAYSQIVDWNKFRSIADSIGAYLLVDMAHIAGLVAAECYPNPCQIADVTTSTTHKTLRGPRGGLILARKNPEIEKKLNSIVFPGTQGGPLMHIIAGKAICFKEAATLDFKTYQQQVIKNAKTMAEVFIQKGFDVVSGGTENHMFLLSLIDKNITGKDADNALAKANITTNKNSVPNDPQSPFITSGLRIGTAAITTRGFKEKESQQIANWICDILSDLNNQSLIDGIRQQAEKLCKSYPVYTP
ncbi:MAG: serine hydroxymethyltransferase [Gammaproteobacteria bacterium]|nr:MAG: serine hydroxymethyltransferase [Gammaproteobacteria bacterium]